MTAHHIIQESDQKNICPYCGNKHLKWKSKFDGTSHYKEHVCSCGRKVTIKVPFMGSGHDSWSKDLDKRVEEES